MIREDLYLTLLLLPNSTTDFHNPEIDCKKLERIRGTELGQTSLRMHRNTKDIEAGTSTDIIVAAMNTVAMVVDSSNDDGVELILTRPSCYLVHFNR